MFRLIASGALIPIAVAVLLAAPLAAQTVPAATPIPGISAPPMSAEDLVTLPRLGAPVVNDAGTLAVYGVTTTDPASLARSTARYLLDLTQPGAVPVALASDTQIDGTRACAMGASYGGYMVNWIAGQWPERFDCLVQHDGIFDTRSFYYATEELWFPRWDFGGAYEEARATYERWNPANHVSKWKTPMLVVTGEQNFRVPYTQGLQSFTALQERGIPAQLLVFPDENHWVLGARNSLQWHQTVFAWLDRWLNRETGQ